MVSFAYALYLIGIEEIRATCEEAMRTPLLLESMLGCFVGSRMRL